MTIKNNLLTSVLVVSLTLAGLTGCKNEKPSNVLEDIKKERIEQVYSDRGTNETLKIKAELNNGGECMAFYDDLVDVERVERVVRNFNRDFARRNIPGDKEKLENLVEEFSSKADLLATSLVYKEELLNCIVSSPDRNSYLRVLDSATRSKRDSEGVLELIKAQKNISDIYKTRLNDNSKSEFHMNMAKFYTSEEFIIGALNNKSNYNDMIRLGIAKHLK